MKTITKKQIIEFIFDFKEVSIINMNRAMSKNKAYLITIANKYESDKDNGKFYRALITA